MDDKFIPIVLDDIPTKYQNLLNAALGIWFSQKVSASTRPPDDPGPGGMMMTGWVRGERVETLFNVLEDDFRSEIRQASGYWLSSDG